MSRYAARGARDDLRRTMGTGVRQICLLLIPSAVLMAVLAEPITRLVYERGAFGPEATDLTSTALVWWSISLPFQGVSLLFSRTFFSLQRPWATTALAGAQPGRERRDLGGPATGRSGSPASCSAPSSGRPSMCVAQGLILRARAGRHRGKAARVDRGPHDGRRRSCSAPWPTSRGRGSTRRSGRSLAAQAVSVLTAIGAGIAVYAAVVWVLRVPEARQIPRLLLRRGP